MKNKYDVIVIGGGTAGVAAGTAAGRCGADTLIIEENAFLGGMATGGMISQFFGLTDTEAFPPRGVVGDVLAGLKKFDACSAPKVVYLAGRKEAGVVSVPYEADILKHVLDEIVLESGATVLLHAKCVGVELESGAIKAVLISVCDRLLRVEAKVVIDASFHGTAAFGTGVPLQEDCDEGNFQPGSLMFRMANVDTERFQELSQEEKKRYASRGIEQGSLYVETIMSRPTGGTGIHFHNMSRVPNNPTDPESWTKAEMLARAQVMKITDFLKREVPGYENAVLCTTGAYMGLRDSRRFKGLYTLNKDDVMAGRKFEDAIAVCSFPIDIHPKDTGFTFVKPGNGEYSIPFRSMVCRECPNLILAGRIISADVYAHASLRVMITCMRIGEAAGKAAAMAVEKQIMPNKVEGAKIGVQ